MLKTTVKKLPRSIVEIEGELEAEVFESYLDKALKKLGEQVEVPGFRKGKVPENILMSQLPESKILEEMAELALADHYPKIIEEHKIDAISRPEVAITKLARKNPLGFKILTSVLPEIKLPDYKKLAQKTKKDVPEADKNITVSEEDLENTIADIRKSRAPKVHMAEGVETSDIKNPMSDVKEELPEFNDEFVKNLGPFKDVADFKEKLKENIKLEKENMAREKLRLNIVEKIVDVSEIDLPEILVEIELDKILYRMESDITAMGLKFEDYLKHLNKTREALRKDFRKDAEKKAKLALILNEIAKTENITADVEQVEKEVKEILERYKEADPERARIHAENILTNERIFQFLESQ
ncbi:MAG: Trigger factor [Parcubacteria group bacterium GW2011_GWA1_47_11]|uniref:Trigger factor n=1 Tax=Candidatus Nomurabacteria bacterium GW2011_GWB1_47_6 TaxID=1618749 RepID=A0A0G1T2E3_9BACT|nr:MAG: Trigger factor [Parcubacteria group bacterium GW2011_GWA1_47_11]KKU75934.1 MAG: Trigger factor [Candidatus Nomurabacteria bacterium GW2011_GWB1_47_6]